MNELEILREQIDKLDEVIAEAYAKRLDIVQQIGEYKRQNNIAVLDSSREEIVFAKVSKLANGHEKEVCDLYKFIMDYSKNKQKSK